MPITYYIKTFGCQSNIADSERLVAVLENRGMVPAKTMLSADYVVLNSCMVRESAENRIYGTVKNLAQARKRHGVPKKIVLTGCMVGGVLRDAGGKMLKVLRRRLPDVDEFLNIEEVGFDYVPVRRDLRHALVPISNGCTNFCAFCVVPYTRGPEVSRPFADIILECEELKKNGYTSVMLLGQNVNSYGSDFLRHKAHSTLSCNAVCDHAEFDDKEDSVYAEKKREIEKKIRTMKPVMVKHLGRYRIPTLFPHLLAMVAEIGFENISFMSSNPWDFSDELIDTLARYKNITRMLHLPVQSGDDGILAKMKRWYTVEEYTALVQKIRRKIPEVSLTTDIIVGFPGETEEAFQNTVTLCKNIGFYRSFTSQYSPRPFSLSAKEYEDDVPHDIKEQRWLVIDKLVNWRWR